MCYSINFFEILLLAIFDAKKPNINIVAITSNTFKNVNSTGYAKLAVIIKRLNFCCKSTKRTPKNKPMSKPNTDNKNPCKINIFFISLMVAPKL